jgi:hypothetical protein
MARKIVTRREFLRLAGLGAGAATLAACAAPTAPPAVVKEVEKTVLATQLVEVEKQVNVVVTATPVPPTPAPAVEVTITTTGWPVDVKSAEDIAADPTNEAYAAAVQAWLDANPGVTMEKVDVPIWDPQAIQAQVAGGTDCTFLFGPCVGGGWGNRESKNAFVQGMLADITPAVTKYDLQGQSLDYLWNSWSNNSQVLGKYYSYPLNEYSPDAGTIIYRKDLVTEKGLKEPAIGWTWEDAATVFKGLTDPENNITGLGVPTWFMGYVLSFHGWDILTQWLPRPADAWKWTKDLTSDPRWAEIITGYRQLLHEDKAILSDVALGGGDEEYFTLFHAGNIAAGRFNYWSMFGRPTEANSLAAMADRLGKPYEEVFGVVSLPMGDGYQNGNGVNLSGGVSFSPNQTADHWDKGVGLVDWMFWDQGLDMTKKGIWDIAQDPRAVFSAFLYMSGKVGYEGVPSSAAEAWGAGVVDSWTNIGKLPVEPSRDVYFPPEQNPAPSGQAIDDQFSMMVTTAGAMDPAALLKKAETDWLNTAKGFSSSTSEALFKAAAKKYYAALDEYFKANYPDFYQNRYKAFFEKQVAPYIS